MTYVLSACAEVKVREPALPPPASPRLRARRGRASVPVYLAAAAPTGVVRGVTAFTITPSGPVVRRVENACLSATRSNAGTLSPTSVHDLESLAERRSISRHRRVQHIEEERRAHRRRRRRCRDRVRMVHDVLKRADGRRRQRRSPAVEQWCAQVACARRRCRRPTGDVVEVAQAACRRRDAVHLNRAPSFHSTDALPTSASAATSDAPAAALAERRFPPRARRRSRQHRGSRPWRRGPGCPTASQPGARAASGTGGAARHRPSVRRASAGLADKEAWRKSASAVGGPNSAQIS